ncbi:MAG: MFS transporter [Flavobacteriales bacterium]
MAHPNQRALILLLGSNAIAEFAHGILMLAIPWYFADTLGHPELFGVLFAVVTFASLFWSLFGGTLIDRFSRKRVLVGLNLLAGTLIGGIALWGEQMGSIPVILVCLGFTITVFNFNIHYPSLYAFAQEISDKGHYARTNSLIEVQGQATRMAASAIAALLLAGTGEAGPFLRELLPFSFSAWTLPELFALDAWAYGATLLFLLPINYQRIEERIVDRGSVQERLKTGVRFLRANPLLFHFGNASYIIFLFVILQAYFLMPVYIKDHLGMNADVYGIGEALFAFGAIGAGYYVRSLMKKVPSVPAIIASMLLSGAVFLCCVWTRSFWVFMGFNLFLGISNSATRVMRITYLFERVPNGVIGRTNSVFQAINILLRSLFTSLFAIPFFTEARGITSAYLISGLAILIGCLPLIYHRRQLQDLDVRDLRFRKAVGAPCDEDN